ncbi:MAG: SDR family NAD(P)-dependent oxidoreductase [Bacteroidota bacterium]
MSALDFRQKWMLITGASSGLGAEMARQLALQFQTNLIVVARREAKLLALKTELEALAKVEVKVKSADLSIPEQVDRVITESLTEVDLYGIVLNAGTTYFGQHRALAWEQFNTIMQTNIMGLMRMIHPAIAHFEETQKPGGILIVSSMAAFSPVPYQAAYSATKAFLSNFANALSHELSNPQFSITVFEPGGIATEMTANEKFNELRGWMMPVNTAAREGLWAFQQRKYRYVPGFFNRIGGFLMRLLPGQFIASRMAKVYRKALAAAEKQAAEK